MFVLLGFLYLRNLRDDPTHRSFFHVSHQTFDKVGSALRAPPPKPALSSQNSQLLSFKDSGFPSSQLPTPTRTTGDPRCVSCALKSELFFSGPVLQQHGTPTRELPDLSSASLARLFFWNRLASP